MEATTEDFKDFPETISEVLESAIDVFSNIDAEKIRSEIEAEHAKMMSETISKIEEVTARELKLFRDSNADVITKIDHFLSVNENLSSKVETFIGVSSELTLKLHSLTDIIAKMDNTVATAIDSSMKGILPDACSESLQRFDTSSRIVANLEEIKKFPESQNRLAKIVQGCETLVSQVDLHVSTGIDRLSSDLLKRIYLLTVVAFAAMIFGGISLVCVILVGLRSGLF